MNDLTAKQRKQLEELIIENPDEFLRQFELICLMNALIRVYGEKEARALIERIK